jgi:hypothetical protein
MTESNDPFDDRIRAAMQRRLERAAPSDLAARAMRIARARTPIVESNEQLRKFRMMFRIVSLAAVMFIGLFVWVGVHRLADHGNLSLTPGNSWTDSSATTTSSTVATSDTSSTDSSPWSGIIIVGVLSLTGLGAATVLRQSSPFGGASALLNAA